MAQWFKEYWYLALIFIGVCIVTAVIFYFAGKSYKSYRLAYRNQEEEIKRLIALKEKFVPLTCEKIASADASAVLEGVALSYQLFLQKKENMEEEFLKLSKEKRYIYILDVFVQEKSVAEFFRENGDILKNELYEALCLIGMNDFADKAERIRKMFDSNDEEISIDEKEVDGLQTFVNSENIMAEIRERAALYIKENSQLFVN